VARVQPGESVPLKILRDGETKDLQVSVKEMPGQERLTKNDRSDGNKDDNGTLNGVTVGDLDRQTRQQFELPANIKGVVITDVAPDSAAAEAGLKPGDIIQEINRKPVKTAEEAVKMTEKSTNDNRTLLRVWSNGGSHFVVVDESKPG